MSLLLFYNGSSNATPARRRYVDDPLYAVAIGNRLPMNIVDSDVSALPTTGVKDGDFLITRTNTRRRLSFFNTNTTKWEFIDLATQVGNKPIRTIDAEAEELNINDYTILCDGSSNTVKIVLPDASTVSGKLYNIKAINITNSITIDPYASQTIDGDATKVIANLYTNIKIQSDGSNWHIL